MFTSAMLFAGWLYLAMWFLTSQRNMAGLFKGLMVIMLLMFAPAREIHELSVSLSWTLQQIAVLWFVFGAGFLLWPRSRRRVRGATATFALRRRARTRQARAGSSIWCSVPRIHGC